MQAYVLHSIGAMRLETMERPKLRENTVLVKVMAAGICGSDVPRIYQTGAHRMPLVPGHEFSGVVEEVGKAVDPKWLEKRVGIFPLMPCMECPQCRKKQYETCQNYNYLGSRTDGGFAQYVSVPEWNLIELPEEVTYEQAAMLEPASVGLHAIRGIGVCREDSAAVCGLGTIGLLIAMHLKGMGVKQVFLLGNKSAQKDAALRLGFPEEDFCNVAHEDALSWLRAKTEGEGADVFFECVGRNNVVNLAVQGTATGGRVMLVGNPASDMELPRDVYWRILRKQLTLRGTWNSSFRHDKEDDWSEVLTSIRQGRIDPAQLITHRFPLEELEKGLRIMRDKTEDYIKIMIQTASRKCLDGLEN